MHAQLGPVPPTLALSPSGRTRPRPRQRRVGYHDTPTLEPSEGLRRANKPVARLQLRPGNQCRDIWQRERQRMFQ